MIDTLFWLIWGPITEKFKILDGIFQTGGSPRVIVATLRYSRLARQEGGVLNFREKQIEYSLCLPSLEYLSLVTLQC